MGEAQILLYAMSNTAMWLLVVVMLTLEDWNVAPARGVALALTFVNFITVLIIFFKGV